MRGAAALAVMVVVWAFATSSHAQSRASGGSNGDELSAAEVIALVLEAQGFNEELPSARDVRRRNALPETAMVEVTGRVRDDARAESILTEDFDEAFESESGAWRDALRDQSGSELTVRLRLSWDLRRTRMDADELALARAVERRVEERLELIEFVVEAYTERENCLATLEVQTENSSEYAGDCETRIIELDALFLTLTGGAWPPPLELRSR